MDSQSFVSFRNVQKSYDGESLVVKNFNLEIEAGEFVTMLGPSGSGKTTCLMMLAGFETVTHGQIPVSYTHLVARIRALSPAEKFGASTRKVLGRYGYTDVQIQSLLDAGAIGESWSEEYLPS